jgi:adenylate kinase
LLRTHLKKDQETPVKRPEQSSLRGEYGVHIPIAEKVFRDLRVDAILLLEGDAEVISVRLTERGDHSWNVAGLVSFATAEVTHATSVASALGLPLRLMRTPNLAQFKEAVEALLSSVQICK